MDPPTRSISDNTIRVERWLDPDRTAELTPRFKNRAGKELVAALLLKPAFVLENENGGVFQAVKERREEGDEAGRDAVPDTRSLNLTLCSCLAFRPAPLAGCCSQSDLQYCLLIPTYPIPGSHPQDSCSGIVKLERTRVGGM